MGRGVFYAVVTITIRLRLDGRSTAYQRSFTPHMRNVAAVTLTFLFIFIYLFI